ncbi:hypothetical protein PF006_g20540 [Phytophthora fragariae]|uniref:RxLR effector protein n=1 Tax=Phytophthora fragariae TaxID=53985 RepID=A0A6A3S523_9STRA|nr:hypothetical protein PF006_g20540 [Phytophthora fragariae]
MEVLLLTYVLMCVLCGTAVVKMVAAPKPRKPSCRCRGAGSWPWWRTLRAWRCCY